MGSLPTSVLLTSAARTTTGNVATKVPESQESAPGANLTIQLSVTAVTGTTPSMTVSIEWSPDGVTWMTPDGTADAFTAITAAAAKTKVFPIKGEYFRLVYTISGTTPSFTFAAWAYVV